MRDWMIALVGWLFGALTGLGAAYLVLKQSPPTPQDSHHIVFHVHTVPGCICKDNIPCTFFDGFKLDDFDKTCYQSPTGKTDGCYPK